MPEVTLGLFPDVGGSWFLRTDARLYGAVRGAHRRRANAHDAKVASVADYFLADAQFEELRRRLQSLAGSPQRMKNRGIVTEILAVLTRDSDRRSTALESAASCRHDRCLFRSQGPRGRRGTDLGRAWSRSVAGARGECPGERIADECLVDLGAAPKSPHPQPGCCLAYGVGGRDAVLRAPRLSRGRTGAADRERHEAALDT